MINPSDYPNPDLDLALDQLLRKSEELSARSMRARKESEYLCIRALAAREHSQDVLERQKELAARLLEARLKEQS